jgi:hypothetical protein
MDKSEEKIIVKFGTDPDINKADALAVASSIEAVATMINEVHKGFNDNHELLVKARPFAPGSLEIPLDIVVLAAVGASLLDRDVISSVLSIIKEYFTIKNLLKGDVPRIENGRVIIKGNTMQAQSITINLLKPSSCANQLVCKAMENAERDESIKDIKIVRDSDQERIAHVDRSEFGYYHKIESTVEIPEEQCRTERTTLVIYGPILDANNSLSWRFKRAIDREMIQANITDEVFLSRVESGEKFAAGDTLEVDLLIRQKYDKMFETYVDLKKGTITKVHHHTPRPEQGRFDYDESD